VSGPIKGPLSLESLTDDETPDTPSRRVARIHSMLSLGGRRTHDAHCGKD